MKNYFLNKNLQTSADLIKVLGEPNRLKIICLLKDNSLCVCEIFAAIKLPQNLVSHHLKVLRDAKIVTSIRSGKKIIYSINKKTTTLLRQQLGLILPA